MNQKPDCFANLDIVFPLLKDGLRSSPESCLKCKLKTECLKSAVSGKSGLRVKEEILDRSYESGITGFFQRWSNKKWLKQNLKD